jgi:hypothetical protein
MGPFVYMRPGCRSVYTCRVHPIEKCSLYVTTLSFGALCQS